MSNDLPHQPLPAISLEHGLTIDPGFSGIVYLVRLCFGSEYTERRVHIPMGQIPGKLDLARALEEIAGELRR